jgi:predicted kinase
LTIYRQQSLSLQGRKSTGYLFLIPAFNKFQKQRGKSWDCCNGTFFHFTLFEREVLLKPAADSPRVLIISGLPCSGKTTLGQWLARALKWPLISKDDIKVCLFDCLGWSDCAWSKKLSQASQALIFLFLEKELQAGLSVIVESNFNAALHSESFANLQRKYNFGAIQLQCVAEGDVLWRRFQQRIDTQSRHPGHLDAVLGHELKSRLLQGKETPLEIEGKIITVDTSDFGQLDYHQVLTAIQTVMVTY